MELSNRPDTEPRFYMEGFENVPSIENGPVMALAIFALTSIARGKETEFAMVRSVLW